MDQKPLKLFFYYVPGKQIDRQELYDIGLAHAVGLPTAKELPLSHRGVEGPDKQRGYIYALGDIAASAIGYFPDQQQWETFDDGKLWVGMNKAPAHRPGPGELARPQQCPGHWVRLNDGNEWQIPIAITCVPDRTPTIPNILGLNKTGELINKPHEAYRALCGEADIFYKFQQKVLESQEEGKDAEGLYEYKNAWNLAMLALGVNYRIGGREASMLSLVDSSNIFSIAQAIIDWPALMEMAAAMQKKTES